MGLIIVDSKSFVFQPFESKKTGAGSVRFRLFRFYIFWFEKGSELESIFMSDSV